MDDKVYGALLAILFTGILVIAFKYGYVGIRGGAVDRQRNPNLFYVAVFVISFALCCSFAIAVGAL